MKQVKAVLYRVDICDSTLDYVHGMKYSINEVFIPKEKLIINEKGGAFKSNKPRFEHTIGIEVPQKLINDVKKMIEIDKKVKPCIERLFSNKLNKKLPKLVAQQPEMPKTDFSSGVIHLERRPQVNPADTNAYYEKPF